MEDSIFTKIIKGEIPSHKIYEDERTFAFLDIYPRSEGHVLVIPKVQVEFVWDLEDADYDALMRSTRKIALRIREVIGSKYVHEAIVGTDVPHAHIHLIPFNHSDDLKQQASTADPNHDALAKVAEKLRLDA